MKGQIRIKPIIGTVVSTLGLLLTGIALGSNYLGIDRSPGWGPARKFMLGLGALMILAPHLRGWGLWLLSWLSKVTGRKVGDKLRIQAEAYPQTSKPVLDIGGDLSLSMRRTRLMKAGLITGGASLLSMAVMLWFMTVGTWRTWYTTTAFIPLLADGFMAGKVHLLVEPDEALLALDDPYPYENREAIPFLWDASLYDGKYYLYWGPTPALLLTPIRGILPESLGDQHIGWFFTSGFVILLLVFVYRIWERYYLHLPLWGFVIPIMAAGIAPPVIWLTSRMAVYETAIASGQFFLLLGLHMLFPWEKQTTFRYFVAGVSWSLAVGSRVTLGPVICILALVYMAWKGFEMLKRQEWKRMIQQFTPFLLPLLIGAALLLWYNYARFGSIYEFGHRYQLGRTDKGELYGSVVSLINFFPNLYNYFLNGFKTIGVFPYVKPRWGQYGIPFLKIFAGGQYHTEKVTGLLVTTPFILFSILPMLQAGWSAWNKLDRPKADNDRIPTQILKKGVRSWYSFMTLVVALTWIPVLLFQASAMRHSVDVAPSLLLLSSMGFGHALEQTRTECRAQAVILILGAGFALYSASMAILLSVTGYYGIIEKLNPKLFYQLTEIFTW